MNTRMNRAEQTEVERHRFRLSEDAGHDVGYDCALADWNANCAVQWRADYQAKLLADQREEILRYKWIESEKAQRDLGRDAVMDWISKYAAQWRAWYETQSETQS